MTIFEFRALQDCSCVFEMTDGEVLKAKIVFVDIEYEDVIVDLLGTNKPERYKDKNAAYAIKAADVLTVEQTSNS